MKKYNFPLFTFLLGVVLFSGCIKDDFIDDRVDPILRFTSSLDTIEIDTEFQLEAMYLNNIGREETPDLTWSSSNPNILSVNQTGLISALSSGTATINVSVETNEGITVSDQMDITVGEETVIIIEEKGGTIRTTSSYTLEGDFTLEEENGGLIIKVAENYRASANLPGLYIYLTNNPATTANALEIGPVQTFEGAHTYEVSDVGISDFQFLLYFCKPFNIKVGDGEIND